LLAYLVDNASVNETGLFVMGYEKRALQPAFSYKEFMSTIRVLIADDHALVRESVRAILANEGDIEIVATAGNGQEAIELTESYQPDVVVMDISMPKMDGIHATEIIRSNRSATGIVILSMHVNAALIQQALRMGARGYVLKRQVTDELPKAIRAAYEGDIFLSSAIPPSYLPR
jgi:two-component system nitrate/nitrite response regulator NarL